MLSKSHFAAVIGCMELWILTTPLAPMSPLLSALDHVIDYRIEYVADS